MVVSSLRSIRKYPPALIVCPEKEIIDWIGPRLKENVGYLKTRKWKEGDLIFTHGDLTGANIVKYGHKLYFIDWERARFVYNVNYGLSYLFLHFALQFS